MAVIRTRTGKKRSARIVSLVVSAMKNLKNQDGCTIRKIVDYIADVGRQNAPKREVYLYEFLSFGKLIYFFLTFIYLYI